MLLESLESSFSSTSWLNTEDPGLMGGLGASGARGGGGDACGKAGGGGERGV